MTSIFRSIVHSSFRRSIQDGSFVQQVLSNTWVFLTTTADFTFTRAGDQFGIDSGGNLVKSTTDVAAFIFGEGVLLEDARTSQVAGSSVLDSAGVDWTGAEAGTATPTVAVTDPEGGLNASLVDLSGGVNARVSQSIAGVGSGATQTYSIWLRSVSGSGTYPMTVLNSTLGHQAFQVNLTTTWKRFDITTTNGTGALFIYVGNRRDGPASTLMQAYVFNPQVELGEIGSSDIVTPAGATATRSATDTRRLWPFPANGISEHIIWRPQYDATDDKGSDLQIINLSDGTENNYLRVTVDQTNDQIHLKKRVSAGTEVVVSTPASALNYVKGDRKSARLVADGNGLDLWVDALAKVSIATGDAPTDWTTTLTTIELNPSFNTVESSQVWNEARSDSFMENLT